MAPVTLEQVLTEPEQVARDVSAALHGVALAVRDANRRRVIFDALLAPPKAFLAQGYPHEEVHILVTSDGGVFAVPFTDRRSWHHRNGDSGDLCLWYEEDAPELRWTWEDGFDVYLMMVHRHVVYEEYYRRHGRWPVEDTPHGRGQHPIVRLETHWQRIIGRRP
jgi:hypothetical protein